MGRLFKKHGRGRRHHANHPYRRRGSRGRREDTIRYEQSRNSPEASGDVRLYIDKRPDQLYIDPKIGTPSQKLDLASRLVKIVHKNGDISLRELEWQLLNVHNMKCISDDCMEEFVRDNDVFKVYNQRMDNEMGDLIVTCKLSIDICSKHAGEAGSCRGNCGSLHICKYFILSNCDIKECKFGHNLGTEHNQRIIEDKFLHYFDEEEIKQLIKNPSNRRGITIPAVCTYYNTEKGCKFKGKKACPFLHICQYFVKNNCRYERTCKRSHDINDEQPRELLERYGLKGYPKTILYNLISKENGLKNDMPPFDMRKLNTISFLNRAASNTGKSKYELGNDFETVSVKSLDSLSDSDGLETRDTERIPGRNSRDEESLTTELGPLEPGWKFKTFDGIRWKMVGESEQKLLEQMYQQYLEAKDHYLSLDGKMYKIDFSTFEGYSFKSVDPSRVTLRRDMKCASSSETARSQSGSGSFSG